MQRLERSKREAWGGPGLTLRGAVPMERSAPGEQSRPAGGYEAGRAVWLGLGALAAVPPAVWLASTHGGPRELTAARFLSGPGNVLFLTGGYLALLVTSARRRDWTAVGAILTTLLLVTSVVHVQKLTFGCWLPRPSGSGGGFPSGHAAAAYALAFLLAVFFPRWSVGWYGVAVGILWSRLLTNSHFPYQVLAGAATGFLLALLLSDRLARRGRHHGAILAYQSLLVAVVPFMALCTFAHEFESDVLLVAGTAVPVIAGVVLRAWPWLRRPQEQRDRIVPYLGNTLICVGVTLGLEIAWLVPLELLLCLTVYTLAERERKVRAEGAVRQALPEAPTRAPLAASHAKAPLSRLLHGRWVSGIGWASFCALVVLKELVG